MSAYNYVMVQSLSWKDLGIEHPLDVVSMVLSPDGSKAFVATTTTEFVEEAGFPLLTFSRESQDGTLALVDVLSVDADVAPENLWFPVDLVMDPAGAYLFALMGPAKNDLSVFSLATDEGFPQWVQSLKVPSPGNGTNKFSLAISPDRRHVYVGGFGGISVLGFTPDSADPLQPLHTVAMGPEMEFIPVESLTIDESGERLIARTVTTAGYSEAINVWEVNSQSGEIGCTISYVASGPTSLPFYGNGGVKRNPLDAEEVWIAGPTIPLRVLRFDGPAAEFGTMGTNCGALDGTAIAQTITYSETFSEVDGTAPRSLAISPDGESGVLHMNSWDKTGSSELGPSGAILVGLEREPGTGNWRLATSCPLPAHCGSSIETLVASNHAIEFSPDSRFVYSAGFHCHKPSDITAPILFVHERSLVKEVR